MFHVWSPAHKQPPEHFVTVYWDVSTWPVLANPANPTSGLYHSTSAGKYFAMRLW